MADRKVSQTGSAGGVIVLAFVAAVAGYAIYSNPGREQHREEITATLSERKGALPAAIEIGGAQLLTGGFEYKDYVLFSTTQHRGKAVSYGFFGKVRVAENVDLLETHE